MHKILNEMNDVVTTKKQKTLGEFQNEENKNGETVLVFADNRERASGIIRELLKLNADVKPQQLLVGDFVISDRIGIERKAANDISH